MESLLEKCKAMPWQVWLHRRYPPFATYLMCNNATHEAFLSQGVDGEFPIILYDTEDWYETEEMFVLAGKSAERYLQDGRIFELTKQCEKILEQGRLTLQELNAHPGDAREDFIAALACIVPANVYIWIAHGSEAYYHSKIREAVRPYVAEAELETFVGDISFPSKKNALALMNEEIRAGASVDEIYKKYAWMKARGGFAPGYSKEEIEEIISKTLQEKEEIFVPPAIPKKIETLVKEVQELVYLRTLRTDTLWELYYLARPIFDRFAKSIHIDSVEHYIPDELLVGKTDRVPYAFAIAKYFDQVEVIRDSIVSQRVVQQDEVRGVVAQKGIVRGIVKILRGPEDANKVESGNVIVTNMTTPAFIAAMHKASAFVTNEGGITCHAAIIAREMKKPCIIGTKIATNIFKDGDVVEVNAETGIVKKCP